MINRNIYRFVKDDLQKKIVLLTGPRQSGKTTFSKSLSPHVSYLNPNNAVQITL